MKGVVQIALIFGLLVGCSRSGPVPSANFYVPTGGTDPRTYVPQQPLSMPKTLASLPTPTPNGTNLADLPQDEIYTRQATPRPQGRSLDTGLERPVPNVVDNSSTAVQGQQAPKRRNWFGRTFQRVKSVFTG